MRSGNRLRRDTGATENPTNGDYLIQCDPTNNPNSVCCYDTSAPDPRGCCTNSSATVFNLSGPVAAFNSIGSAASTMTQDFPTTTASVTSTITAAGTTIPPTSPTPTQQPFQSGLSAGAKAGIAIGVIAGVAAVAAAVFLLLRSRRRNAQRVDAGVHLEPRRQSVPPLAEESASKGMHGGWNELPANNEPVELWSDTGSPELGGGDNKVR